LVNVKGIMVLLIAVLLILLGGFLWKKGRTDESFWEALFNVIGDILVWHLPIFATFRAWAVFSWLIGFGILIIAIASLLRKLN
jgi:hypothetical protein